MPVPSVARPSAPSTSAETAQEPSPSAKATSSSVARRRPRPGARKEIASIRLVLPAPFGPTSTTGRSPTLEAARRDSCGNWSRLQASDAGGGHVRDISIRSSPRKRGPRIISYWIPGFRGSERGTTRRSRRHSHPHRHQHVERVALPSLSWISVGEPGSASFSTAVSPSICEAMSSR